jgi:hypothetical protein
MEAEVFDPAHRAALPLALPRLRLTGFFPEC